MYCFIYFKIFKFDFDFCFFMIVVKFDVVCVVMEIVVLVIYWGGGYVFFVRLIFNVYIL